MVNCPECNSESLYKKGFRDGKQRYQCKNCGRYFVEGTKYTGEQAKVPSIVKECPQCGSINIKRDGRLKDGTSRYECKDCGKNFSSKTVIRPHVEYKCPYCEGKLRRAGKGKIGKQQYKCLNCGKTSSGSPPKKLISFKESNKDVHCPYCDSMNLVLSGTIKGKIKYICRNCHHTFTESTKERLEKVKKEREHRRACPYCGSNRINLGGITKANNQRFKCLDCKRSYIEGIKVFSEEDKKKILMFRLNIGLPVHDIAEHFKCTEYFVRQLEKEYKINLVQNRNMC